MCIEKLSKSLKMKTIYRIEFKASFSLVVNFFNQLTVKNVLGFEIYAIVRKIELKLVLKTEYHTTVIAIPLERMQCG